MPVESVTSAWAAEPGGLGGCSPPGFAKFSQNLPFLPQILAFLCLQSPHVPVSPHTFKFTPPSMEWTLIFMIRSAVNLYITDAMSQNFVTLEVVRELLQTQERSYQAAIKLLITDVGSEMKDIKKEIEEFKDSLEFTQREVNDNQDRVIDIETRLEGLKVRIDDQMDTIEKVEDNVEYIENQSRRNNIKILGVEENDTTEKSWDDTIPRKW